MLRNRTPRDPFLNHVATLVDYINSCREPPKTDTRGTYMCLFFLYITNSCWAKSLRRLRLPSSVGFLVQLHRVKEETLKTAFQAFQTHSVTVTGANDQA